MHGRLALLPAVLLLSLAVFALVLGLAANTALANQHIRLAAALDQVAAGDLAGGRLVTVDGRTWLAGRTPAGDLRFAALGDGSLGPLTGDELRAQVLRRLAQTAGLPATPAGDLGQVVAGSLSTLREGVARQTLVVENLAGLALAWLGFLARRPA